MTRVLSTDPRTGEAVPTNAIETTNEELEEVVGRAAAAGRSLAAAPPADRATALRAVATALRDDGEALVSLAERETALGHTRLEGEVERAAGQFDLFASVLEDGDYLEVIIDHADPDTGQPDVRRMLDPVGPTAVFGASNFPFAFSVAGGDTASAMAAGCAVVAKAHPSHPLTSVASARAIRRGIKTAGFPPDCLTLVHGIAAGAALVRHPTIQAVGFTGSLAGGRALHDLAASRPSPIPFYGELGSLNPLVVTPAAAKARGNAIAQGFLESYTLGLGQFCTKPGLVLFPAGEASAFVEHLGERVAAHPGGFLLNLSIQQSFRRHIESLGSNSALAELIVSTPAAGAGTSTEIALAVVDAAEVDWSDTSFVDECFGPYAIVVRYQSTADALRVLEALPPSLSGTIHAEDVDSDAAPVFEALRRAVGRVVWNGYPTGVRVSWAMHHGGPYPASTNALHTSVGATAIRRFLRPVAYQGVPDSQLPEALREDNPLRLPRRVDGHRT